MEELSIEFDVLFKNSGGIATFVGPTKIFMENILDHGNNLIDLIRFDKPDFFVPYLNYIENSSINAVASKYRNNYFIGINTGTVYLIHELFQRMLSSPNILKEWGNAELEGETKKIYNAELTDAQQYYIAKDPFEDILPKDKTRNALSELLTIHAMKFLYLHEYGHIINGHLDYMESVSKKFTYFEIGETMAFNSLTLQTLEYDADSYGAYFGMRETSFNILNRDKLHIDFQPFFKDFETAISLWSFAVYTVFRLFANGNTDLELSKKLSHPTAGIRQQTVMALAITYCLKDGLADAHKIANILVREGLKVEDAFREISLVEIDSTYFSAHISKDEYDYMIEIKENWKNVRPLLEPFNRNGLAPIE